MLRDCNKLFCTAKKGSLTNDVQLAHRANSNQHSRSDSGSTPFAPCQSQRGSVDLAPRVDSEPKKTVESGSSQGPGLTTAAGNRNQNRRCDFSYFAIFARRYRQWPEATKLKWLSPATMT